MHQKNFNPLHREGGDYFAVEVIEQSKRFQSTPPRGWRRPGIDAAWDGAKFQSTPPRGWRRLLETAFILLQIFQSTPPRGWRLHYTPKRAQSQEFQSTPPRGWRQQYYTITTTILHHISTNKSYPTPLKSRPTIPAHSQIRSHCANFPVRIPP